MNNAGGLFKTGLIVTNCHVVIECNRWVAGVDQKKAEAAATKKVDQSVDTLNKAKRAYAEWVRTGRKVDANGCPDLDRPLSYARLCIPAGFPGIPAGMPFLQIFYRNYIPARTTEMVCPCT